MLLNVQERLGLFLLLPEKGSFANLKLLRVLREELALTAEEKTRIDWHEENGNATWTSDKSVDVDIALTPEMHVLVKTALLKLDEAEQLPSTAISLYEKIVNAKD